MPSLQIAVTMYAPLYVNSLQRQRRENPDSRTFTVTVQRIRDDEKCTSSTPDLGCPEVTVI
jgi:hypothetical protein